LNLDQNPVMRMLAVVVAIAVSIRLVYWLLLPVIPYLCVVVFVFAVVWVVRWYGDRR
jgi:hypothetical protein